LIDYLILRAKTMYGPTNTVVAKIDSGKAETFFLWGEVTGNVVPVHF